MERKELLPEYSTAYKKDAYEVWEAAKKTRNRVFVNQINQCFDERCNKCGSLRFDVFNKVPMLCEFVFGSEEDYFCNFKCIYCGGDDVFNNNILPILRTIRKWEIQNLLSDHIMVSFAKGELFARGDCNEILEYLMDTKWNVGVLTNGSIYNNRVAKLVKQGKYVVFNCSLDAGTSETFYIIKGVDCFDRVVENLLKYKKDGVIIELKYIMLDGINSNMIDIEKFFKIAEMLNANVILAANNLKRDIRLSDNAIGNAQVFVKMAIKGRINSVKAFKTSIMRNFNIDDAKILCKTIEEELNK